MCVAALPNLDVAQQDGGDIPGLAARPQQAPAAGRAAAAQRWVLWPGRVLAQLLHADGHQLP